MAWVPGGSASGEGHANAETNKAMKALNELVHSHRCRSQQRQDPTHRLGGTTGISKASVSTGGTRCGRPCAQRHSAAGRPRARGPRASPGQGPRCGTPTEHDAPVAQSELGRVRHGQRDGLGRCSCITPPRDKSGAATSDSGAQGVSSEAPGPAPQRSCTPHGVLHRCCAQ